MFPNSTINSSSLVHDRCPVCDSPSLSSAFPNEARDPITGDSFQILSCNSCGIGFTSPFPENLEDYYPSQYRGYSPLIMGVLRMFYLARVNCWHRMRAKPGMALEIGCGPGLMLEAMARKGWRVKGLERTEAVATFAREKFGLDVTSEDLNDLPAVPTYDLIILFNVLEHLSNPIALLKACSERLNQGGKIIINVPNFKSTQARFSKELWLHLDPPRHLFHFSPESLQKLLSNIGMKGHSFSFVSLEHDPFGWVESLINRITRRQNTLTLFLMGLKPFCPRVALSMVLATVLAGPALLLSIISWLTGDGALFQVVAEKKES